jgi:hypothetical protein
MAKVTLSELAPDELVRFYGWQVEFELGGSAKSSLETDDRTVIGYAEAHPWLSVEYPKGEQQKYALDTLAEHPERDALSGFGPDAGVPFDPEEIKKVEEAKVNERPRVAIDAGLDQGKSIEVGDHVAVTLAADDEHDAAKSQKATGVAKSSTTDKKGDA